MVKYNLPEKKNPSIHQWAFKIYIGGKGK